MNKSPDKFSELLNSNIEIDENETVCFAELVNEILIDADI